MIKMSYFLGRKVIVKLKTGAIIRGLFEQWKDNEYYIVFGDGSRRFFNQKLIACIYYL